MNQKLNDEQRFFLERLSVYRKNVEVFANEVFNFLPDEWQKGAFKDIVESNRISIKSGQGVGKTAFEAICVLWFLTCFEHPRIVVTAPTRQQLHDVMWSEIAKWMSKSVVLTEILRWTKTYVYMSGFEKRWFAVARTANRPENMQGFHEDNMLFIVDEASGVSDDIMEAILGTLSGENNKLVLCGNPTQTTGTFHDSHTVDRAMYRCRTVSSMDSPRTSKENIDALIKKYGAESNVVKVRVYGEFPLQEDDVFIPLSLIESAINNDLDESEKPESIAMGVDVARFGSDDTVIGLKTDGVITIPIIRHGQNLMRTVGDIVVQYKDIIKKYPKYKGYVICNIDDTGLGGGVTDRLNEVKLEERLDRLIVNPVNFGSSPPSSLTKKDNTEYYGNISTYMWGVVRDMMQDKLLRLPNDPELVAQFSVRKYSLTSNGKIILESKDDMKKRGIKSPDRAEAVALSCYKPKTFSLKNLVS